MPEPKLYSLAAAAKILSENAPPPKQHNPLIHIGKINARIAELETALGLKASPKTFNMFRGNRRIEFLESELEQKNAGTLAPAPVAIAPVAVAPAPTAPTVAAAPAPVAAVELTGRERYLASCKQNPTGVVNTAAEDAKLRVDRPAPAAPLFGRARAVAAFKVS